MKEALVAAKERANRAWLLIEGIVEAFEKGRRCGFG